MTLEILQTESARNDRVFGSVARDEDGLDSHLDSLVFLDLGRNIFDLGALLTDLRDQLHLPVNLVESGHVHPVIRDPVLPKATPLSPQKSRMLTISSSQTSYKEDVERGLPSLRVQIVDPLVERSPTPLSG